MCCRTTSRGIGPSYDLPTSSSRTHPQIKSSLAAAPKAKGNVHTGAMPPWMMSDDGDEGCGRLLIGPSEEAFIDWSKYLAF